MKRIIKLLLTSILVYFLASITPGVAVDGVLSAVVVALVLALLNLLVKPILIFLTLPATLVTFGLFLLVINAIVVMICDRLVAGFQVSSFGSALCFSLLLSFLQSVLFRVAEKQENKGF